MRRRRAAPYGSWHSPVSAASVARSGVGLAGPLVSGDDLYWIESRPTEEGRNVVVVRSGDGAVSDVTPAGFNARTRVHEYGGGSFFVHDGTVFFSSFGDQRIYRQEGPGAPPQPITPAPENPGGVRYADGAVTPEGDIVCVRETHTGDGVAIDLVRIPADGNAEPRTIASGHDFYSYPRVSPDGSKIAWTTWDHPRMPWEGTELWLGDPGADGIANVSLVAGGPKESIFQPQWGPDGRLYFASDRTGWWNLYRLEENGPRLLAERAAEFGGPQWQFGYSSYDFLPDGRIACVYSSGGYQHLAVLDPESGDVRDVETPFSTIFPWIEVLGTRVVVAAAGPSEPRAIVAVDVETGEPEVLRLSREDVVDPGYVSVPTAIEFPTDGGLSSHAFFYPPQNTEYEGPPSERPPLIVLSHGGPTGATFVELDDEVQFFTSRGFGVVDVNYGGSTGYGRAYRERLNGRWGIVDTADCINAARYLAEKGEVDGDRLIIRGGSAGGYTTLCALVFHDVFSAGASYFGVADIEALARDTHNFESRYFESLIGPYPEMAAVYRERSPVHFVDRISCPLILLQGLDDEVVPPSQSEIMVAALRQKGIPFAYLAFEGEQHGFRRAETIQRSVEAELYFFGRVFGIESADDIEPVAIENL